MPAATTNNPVGSGYALFDSAIGRCAMVWRGQAVIGVALPESTDERARASLARRFPSIAESEPPPFVRTLIARIAGHLAGQPDNLGDVPVDLDGAEPFDLRVWEAARRIPSGEVRSYGDIAQELGAPRAAQAVGAALGRNPVPIIVPCHRILATGGRSGGFSAPGGIATKFKILEIEGARRSGDPELFEVLPLAVKPGRDSRGGDR